MSSLSLVLAIPGLQLVTLGLTRRWIAKGMQVSNFFDDWQVMRVMRRNFQMDVDFFFEEVDLSGFLLEKTKGSLEPTTKAKIYWFYSRFHEDDVLHSRG